MKVRAVLFDSSSFYLHHWLRLVPPAIVLSACAALPTLLSASWWSQPASLVLSLPIVYLLQAIHIIDNAETRLGHARAGVPEELRHIRRRLKTLLWAYGLLMIKLGLLSATALILTFEVLDRSSAAGIGSLGALLLLVVFLLTRWSLITPVVLLENVGAQSAFRRSQQLVRGHSVRMLGVLLVARLVPLVVLGLIHLVATGLIGNGQLRDFIRDVISGPLADPFVALVWTDAYFALRSERGELLENAPARIRGLIRQV